MVNEYADPRAKLCINMLAWAKPKIVSEKWHWFGWLFAQKPIRPFVSNLISECAACELKLDGLGWALLRDVVDISGKEKYEPHYEMLLQKLAEILVLGRLLNLHWPDGTCFEHEPSAKPDGKRPELKVETEEEVFLFEVKAPALLSHKRARSENPIQFPGRMFDLSMRDKLAGDQSYVLPRDNPIKDFLISAEEKFSEFASDKDTIGVLIIVWDDFMFEPITSLIHSESQGLLTDNSFARNEDGSPVTYPNINSVIVLRHLLYFQQGADETLSERKHCFDFGVDADLPNVAIPVPGKADAPDFIKDGLRALHYEDEKIKNFADYRPQEFVMWFNV